MNSLIALRSKDNKSLPNEAWIKRGLNDYIKNVLGYLGIAEPVLTYKWASEGNMEKIIGRWNKKKKVLFEAK